MVVSQHSIIAEQTNLLTLQQQLIRTYQTQLALIHAEAEAELARVEEQGGMAGFPQRILRLAERRP